MGIRLEKLLGFHNVQNRLENFRVLLGDVIEGLPNYGWTSGGGLRHGLGDLIGRFALDESDPIVPILLHGACNLHKALHYFLGDVVNHLSVGEGDLSNINRAETVPPLLGQR